MAKKISLLCIILILSGLVAVGAEDLDSQERIESFSSRIIILPDGGIEVTERIMIVSHGEEFKWGFERIIPRWQDLEQGLRRALDVQVLEVYRDGVQEPWELEQRGEDLVLVVGDTDDVLPPGLYSYSITYRVAPFVQHAAAGESLAWNVTGEWPLVIRRATAVVEFARAPRPQFSDYSSYINQLDGERRSITPYPQDDWVQYSSSKPLLPGETMAIWAAWPEYIGAVDFSNSVLDLTTNVGLTEEQLVNVREEYVLNNSGAFDQGFHRDFTGVYADGKRRDLDITAVTLDGRTVSWRLEPLSTGYRLWVDEIPRGNSTLGLEFSLDRQLIVGEELEELRWTTFNPGVRVWQTTVNLNLPSAVEDADLLLAGFVQGDRAADRRVFHYTHQNQVVFASTRALEAGEVMVNSLAWPQGLLPPLTWQQELRYFIGDNLSWLLVAGIFILLLLWYLPLWVKRGRRWLTGDTVNTPPKDFSPAALRFLSKGKYDGRVLMAGILSLATKGCLMIIEEGGRHVLVNSGVRPGNLPQDEAALLETLFLHRMAVVPDKHKQIMKETKKAHGKALAQEIDKMLYRSNAFWVWTASILSTIAILLIPLALPGLWVVKTAALLAFVAWGWFICFLMGRTVEVLPRAVDEIGWGPPWLAVLIEVGVVGSLTFYLARWLVEWYNWPMVIGVLAVILVNGIMAMLLPGPTQEGRKVLTQAKGFRRWLIHGSGDARPGGPSRFEKFLPHAMALDASGAWGRRFGRLKRKNSLNPKWYMGSSWHTINAATLAAALSDLPKSKTPDAK